MKRIAITFIALALSASAAFGQAQLGAGQVWGNPGASRAPPKAADVTAIFDQALSGVRGSIIERGAAGWVTIAPGIVGKAFVSGGAGADPSYGTLGVVGGGTGLAAGTSGGIPYFDSTSSMQSSGALLANRIVLGGGAGLAPTTLGSLGTTTTVLHGNAAGAPSFGAVVSADLNITSTTCTNQFISAISTGGVGTCASVNLTNSATGTLQAAQFPTLTGDVTTPGASLATTIAANAVTNAKMATMAANTVKANATGGSATPTDVTAATARSSSLLNVDQFTGHGDSIYTILATDRTVGTNAAFTASRTWTLPAANAVNAGQEIIVADFQGTVTGTNTLIVARAGSDTINGGTSITMSTANAAVQFRSDGTSKWTAQTLGAGSGTVTSVTCGTGLSGGVITTTGTCALALTNARLQASPGNPTGTTSGTGLMMGLGTTCTITPTYSGRLQLGIHGQFANASAAQGTISLRFGTGTAPTNGAALTGTLLETSIVAIAAGIGSNVRADGNVAGLSAGTAYWFDVGLATSAGTGSLNTVSCSAVEF